MYFANSVGSVGRLSWERTEGGAQGIGERQCWDKKSHSLPLQAFVKAPVGRGKAGSYGDL